MIAGANTPLGPLRNIEEVSPGAAMYMSHVRSSLASPELPWRGENFECATEVAGGDPTAAARALLEATDRLGPCTLLTLGPLSNVALAERLRPGWLSNLSSLVVMGGSLRVPGDAPGGAEWNFYLDSQAAHEVLAAAPPSTLIVPNDVANEAVFDAGALEALLEEVNRASSPHSEACRVLLGIDPGAGRYDPLAAACLVAPELRGGSGATASLGVSSDQSSGVLREDGAGVRVRVATGIDIAEYHSVLRDGLAMRSTPPPVEDFSKFADFIREQQRALVAALEAADGTGASASPAFALALPRPLPLCPAALCVLGELSPTWLPRVPTASEEHYVCVCVCVCSHLHVRPVATRGRHGRGVYVRSRGWRGVGEGGRRRLNLAWRAHRNARQGDVCAWTRCAPWDDL